MNPSSNPNFYRPGGHPPVDTTVSAPGTDTTVHEAASRAGKAMHGEILNDIWSRPPVRKESTPREEFSGLSGLENTILQFGANGRKLSQLADLAQNDGGTTGEVTSEDLDEALRRDASGVARLSKADRAAIQYMQNNLAEISHENDAFGGGWFDVVNYALSKVDLMSDDSISLSDLRGFAAERGVTYEGTLAATRGQTQMQTDNSQPKDGRTDGAVPKMQQTDPNITIKAGERSYTYDSDGILKYTIQKGDSVSKVAADLLEAALKRPATEGEVGDYVRKVVAASKLDQGGRDPDLIFPGDSLKLPPPYETQARA